LQSNHFPLGVFSYLGVLGVLAVQPSSLGLLNTQEAIMGRGPYSTAKQQAAMKLRYECGATIGQIADWLKISERAVRARLQNARRAANPARTAESVMVDMHRQRTFAASQISSGDRAELDLDAL
jgi:hypothetical protein